MPAPAKAKAAEYVDASGFHIYLDSPEIGLVSLTYEASVGEWNLDDTASFGRTLVVPEPVFRKAAENFLKGE